MATTHYEPPFTITAKIVHLTESIGEAVGKLSVLSDTSTDLRLRRTNRIQTIHGSLAIEGNTLSEDQITAVLNGKRILAPPRDVVEVKNAIAAYEKCSHWDPLSEKDLLKAHRIMMEGLVESAGRYRRSGVGVVEGSRVVHMAPPAKQVPHLMHQLLEWLRKTTHHPLIASSVFHFEFEFIHPFTDGNGRMGRLWQTVILSQWNPLFLHGTVESSIRKYQEAYYQALQNSTRRADCAPFIEFMLWMIEDSLGNLTPQVAPHVTPQVKRVLQILQGEMTRGELQKALRLADRKSFHDRYLAPAIAAGFVERTIPEKPTSRHQKYRLTEKGKNAS